MGDLGDLYRDLHETQQKARLERLTRNLEALRRSTVPFVYHEGIATCLIRGPGLPKIDFYPSTGRYKILATGRVVFGDTEQLLQFLWNGCKKNGVYRG